MSAAQDEASNRDRLTHEELDQKFFLPLGVQGTLVRVYQVFVAQWSLFLAINGVAVGLIVAVVVATFLFVKAAFAWDQGEDNGSRFGWNYAVAVFVELFIFCCIQSIADGANIRAVAEVYAGRSPNIMDCLKESGYRILSLLGACALVGVFMLIPSSLLIWYAYPEPSSVALFAFFCTLLALYCLVVLLTTYLMYAAVIVEGAGPISSCRRSIQLSHAHWPSIMLPLLVFTLFKILLKVLVSKMPYLHYNHRDAPDDDDYEEDDWGWVEESTSVSYRFGSPFSVLFLILFAALGSILQAVIFLNVGVMKEGLTSKRLSDKLGLSEGEGDSYAVMADKNEVPVV